MKVDESKKKNNGINRKASAQRLTMSEENELEF
jgi:hypothetical protein